MITGARVLLVCALITSLSMLGMAVVNATRDNWPAVTWWWSLGALGLMLTVANMLMLRLLRERRTPGHAAAHEKGRSAS